MLILYEVFVIIYFVSSLLSIQILYLSFMTMVWIFSRRDLPKHTKSFVIFGGIICMFYPTIIGFAEEGKRCQCGRNGENLYGERKEKREKERVQQIIHLFLFRFLSTLLSDLEVMGVRAAISLSLLLTSQVLQKQYNDFRNVKTK
jgi:hypothetical protein